MSIIAAKKLEEVLAEFGILLEGSDPTLLEEHRIEPKALSIDGPPADGTPEEIRQRCADGLFEIASKIIDDGMSLAKLASKVMITSGSARRRPRTWPASRRRCSPSRRW